MSDEKGNNKRTVKKTNKGNKTMNIKISTEDIDDIYKNNNTIENTKTSKIRYLTHEDQDVDIFTKTKNLENELKSMKLEMNKTAREEFKKIEYLNNKISELDEKQNELKKENVKLLTQFKGIEKDVSKKFENKFKLAKIVAKEKEKANEQNLDVIIKARTQQVNTMQKNINREKKSIQVIEKKLKLSGKDVKLNEELLKLNNKINEFENEIKELNDIKDVHQNCEKDRTTLTSKYNILSNEIDFENKVKDMVEVQKKERTKIKINTENMIYSEELRKKQLKKVKEKYSAKKI